MWKRDLSTVTETQILDGSFFANLKRKVGISVDTRAAFEDYDGYKEITRNIHLDYLEAGAQVIRTNTFRCDYKSMGIGVQRYGTLIHESVLRVREAIEMYISRKGYKRENYWIAGSCGSATNCKAFGLKNFNSQEIMDFHRLRIQMLSTCGVDAIALESIETLNEAIALTDLLKEFPRMSAWISFRCRGRKMLDGNDLPSVARMIYTVYPQIFAIGINCVDPSQALSIIEAINIFNDNDIKRTCNSKIPLVVCPRNSNPSADISTWTAMQFQNRDPRIISKYWNVRLIGGCCKVLPNDIKHLSTNLIKRHGSLIKHYESF